MGVAAEGDLADLTEAIGAAEAAFQAWAELGAFREGGVAYAYRRSDSG